MAYESGGVTPYQPVPSIQPKYGFRYSSSTFAPAVSPIDVPPMVYTSTRGTKSSPTTVGTGQVMGSDDSNQENSSAADSTQLSIDKANEEIGNMNMEDEQGKMMHSPEFNPMSLVPGIGTMSGLMGDSIPKSGFGADGTYSALTGGKFDGGRSYDPITGYANQEYSTMGSFRDNFMSNPFANTFGDKANAYDYNRRFGDEMLEVQFAKDKGLDTDSTEFKQKVLTDKGIPISSLQGDDNPTMDATDINNYTIGPSGELVAPTGSQYSITGTFATESDKGFKDINEPVDQYNETIPEPVIENNPGVGNEITYVDTSNEQESSNDNDGSSAASAGMDEEQGGWGSQFNTGGLVPALGMNKRNRDIPHPIMQDPLAGFI